VIWAVRAAEPDWAAVDDDPLPELAALNAAADELGRGASPAIELRAGRLVEALTGHGNMTVTPRNLGQVAEVVRDCRDMGYRMFSFQPAA
jgi:hypothetical protein